jgi:hypothetical protein
MSRRGLAVPCFAWVHSLTIDVDAGEETPCWSMVGDESAAVRTA